MEHSEKFITQAAPTIIRPSRRRRPHRQDDLTVAMGDAQIGYYEDEPFHDERAMALGVLACLELQPDNIVLTGDMIDLPGFSSFAQRSEWLGQTQKSIDRYHNYLAELRAASPNSNIVAVHGNHELRMDRMIRQNAAELLGIRRANMAHELAVLTLQYLVRYDDLEVTGVDGWPNAAYWLTDNLKVTHGTGVRKAGSNAATYLANETTSTIYGHSHRMEIAYRTRASRLGGLTIAAASPGCLARIDGYVPGFHFSTDERGSIVPRAEDWQQGALIVTHNARNHDMVPAKIDEEGIHIYGRSYGNVDK